jgi:hypothetical protein
MSAFAPTPPPAYTPYSKLSRPSGEFVDIELNTPVAAAPAPFKQPWFRGRKSLIFSMVLAALILGACVGTVGLAARGRHRDDDGVAPVAVSTGTPMPMSMPTVQAASVSNGTLAPRFWPYFLLAGTTSIPTPIPTPSYQPERRHAKDLNLTAPFGNHTHTHTSKFPMATGTSTISPMVMSSSPSTRWSWWPYAHKPKPKPYPTPVYPNNPNRETFQQFKPRPERRNAEDVVATAPLGNVTISHADLTASTVNATKPELDVDAQTTQNGSIGANAWMIGAMIGGVGGLFVFAFFMFWCCGAWERR